MMQQGYGVKLPQSRNAPPTKTEPIAVTIPASFRIDSRVQLNGEWVRLDVLAERMRQVLQEHASKDVTVATDGVVTMNEWARVADKLIEAGVVNVGFLTQPPSGGRP
jgi:biopolymer transport protein ExbD